VSVLRPRASTSSSCQYFVLVPRMSLLVVTVDGGIGAGKSVYINMIARKLSQRGWRITIIKEPVEKWRESGILDLFYKDPKRWAYHFQTKAFHDRVVENIDAFAAHGATSDIFILERSPFTDNLFMEVLHDDHLVTELEYRDYQQWWALWYKVMPYAPNMFIYLRPDIDVQMARIEERNRSEELSAGGKGGVTKEYQEKLVAKHDEFFKDDMVKVGTDSYAPCVKLVTNENFRDDLSTQEKFADHFETLITSLANIKKLH
jgi:deoxyadenosine/deoxycytidine kinase